jgi:homoserine kinase
VDYTPAVRPSTAASRGTLPATVSHADAARNAGRAALLVAAMTTAPRELMAATEDRLHQPYRLPAFAEGAALIARLRAAGVPAVLSGSGPTVLALCRDSAESAVAHGLSTGGFEPCELSIDLEGTTCAAAEG